MNLMQYLETVVLKWEEDKYGGLQLAREAGPDNGVPHLGQVAAVARVEAAQLRQAAAQPLLVLQVQDGRHAPDHRAGQPQRHHLEQRSCQLAKWLNAFLVHE